MKTKDKMLRASPFVRCSIIGLLIVINMLFIFRKYGDPGQVLDKADLDRICKSVTGCKSISTDIYYKPDSAATNTKIVIRAAKNSKTAELKTKIIDQVDRLWAEKAGFLAPNYIGKAVEVRSE